MHECDCACVHLNVCKQGKRTSSQPTVPKAIFSIGAIGAFVQILHKLFTTACGEPAAVLSGISARDCNVYANIYM